MFVYPKEYEVIVVGAGHAGVEAALAASKIGCQTLLLTTNPDTIGQMSCNPAIGGSAKGHMVREIDALGGIMGRAADMAGIQFRMLNTRKGPAVWSPRAQCDKKTYQLWLKWVCEQTKRVDVKLGQVSRILVENDCATGVEIESGVCFRAKTVVITTGTFLRGLLHVGDMRKEGGRAGEGATNSLSNSLKDIGFELGRFKTGTPPRLARSSIDFSKTCKQFGDDPPQLFSFWKDQLFHVEQPADEWMQKLGSGRYICGSLLERVGAQSECFLTRTSGETARIIKNNLAKSPLYSGIIEGVGPRYCPSIEDKIMRFQEKDSHQIFLEPEGILTEEIYVNGLSTSMPIDIQYSLVRSIIGCENAEIIRPAYAVEYDFVFPTQVKPSLETKKCSKLFLAGQINGTSGYEEAAAQGIIAGINAARSALGKPPFVLGRDQAYIGVLIDDLVTKGAFEPYRMHTSRAEYRLTLRHDNADLRLSRIGHELGLISDENYEIVSEKQRAIDEELERLRITKINGRALAELLRNPETTYDRIPGAKLNLSPGVIRQVETTIKYEGYVSRQDSEIRRFKALESATIPIGIDYDNIPSLRTEARQKLRQVLPTTLGQALRISGVSPADASVLMIWINKSSNHCQPADVHADECP